jgi:hypothetical protein
MLKVAYRLNRELGGVYRTAFIVCRFARAIAVAGRPETAVRVLSSGEAMLEAIHASSPWIERLNEETFATLRPQLDEVAFAEAWQQGRKLTADEAVALALDSPD